MTSKSSRPIADLEAPEQAAAHDQWFHSKVEAALSDKRPVMAHEDAMAAARRSLETKANKSS